MPFFVVGHNDDVYQPRGKLERDARIPRQGGYCGFIRHSISRTQADLGNKWFGRSRRCWRWLSNYRSRLRL